MHYHKMQTQVAYGCRQVQLAVAISEGGQLDCNTQELVVQESTINIIIPQTAVIIMNISEHDNFFLVNIQQLSLDILACLGGF